MKYDKIAVVDFGGQYTHLIASKIRRLNVLSEIREPDEPLLAFQEYKGIILSGSPSLSSFDEDSGYTRELFELPIPILGLCFGHQEMAKYYAGKVEHTKKEYGYAELHIVEPSPVFEGLGPREQVWLSHGDTVTVLPPGFRELGYTTLEADEQEHRNAAIACHEKKRYGLQFHPEVDDTPNGEKILANFVLNICGCRPDWTVSNYMENKLEEIQKHAGDRKVFLLVSGGVDSTVCARLIGRAVGEDRLFCLHIDNGLMRKNESRRVIEAFKRYGMGEHLHFVDASEEFLSALRGVVDPEEKRRIIGHTFIEIVQREAEVYDLENFIVGQGTIYPDTIETGGTKRADVIKTHHNRVKIIREMIKAGKIIEPIKELYKEEVRELGRILGIGEELLRRHPFPGPGLGVRLLCAQQEPEEYRPEILNPRLNTLAVEKGLSADLLPVKSVGVKGDLRSYELPVLLTGPEARWEDILTIAGKIPREVASINRCVYNLLKERFSSIELVPAEVTRKRLDLLREVDAIVMEGLELFGLLEEIWQCPTILLPLRMNGRGEEFAVIRPVRSQRAMTAAPARLPQALLDQLKEKIVSFPKISGLGIDVTTKPPGTIEWE